VISLIRVFREYRVSRGTAATPSGGDARSPATGPALLPDDEAWIEGVLDELRTPEAVERFERADDADMIVTTESGREILQAFLRHPGEAAAARRLVGTSTGTELLLARLRTETPDAD
jgi:hypothetical protein